VAQKRTKKALFWGNAFFRLTHYKLLESLVVNVVTTNVQKLEAANRITDYVKVLLYDISLQFHCSFDEYPTSKIVSE